MTRVEAAYIALHGVLTAASQEQGSPLPAPKRNAALHTALDAATGAVTSGVFLNLHDDDPRPVGDLAGGPRGEKEFYVVARLEWVVGLKDAARDARFDAGMEAIAAALQADRTLGGVVDDTEIDLPRRADLAILGAQRLKGATVPILMLITANTYLG